MSVTIPTQTDKCRGAMIATAIGDALGWPNEIRSKNKSKNAGGGDNFVAWIRRNNKPCYHDEKILPGEYSDDTQLILSVARSIIVGNWEKFFSEKELVFWLKYERGGGKALLNAAKLYKDGVLPWQSKRAPNYFNAGGNGAVMRILPHVISQHKISPSTDLMSDIIKNSILTHGHPRAILGATCYAFALDYLLKKKNVLSYGELVSAVIDGQRVWGSYPDSNIFSEWLNAANQYFDYQKEWNNVLSSMLTQLDFIKASLKKGLILEDSNVLTQLGCYSKISGAGDVAILAAIYLVSRYANNPVLGMKVPASSVGIDTDTIASITGGLLGMLCGTDWIPPEWTIVQDYKCLNLITEMLLSDNSKQAKNLELENTSEGSSNWVRTAIGRARCLEATEVQSGKYSTVTIQKWQTALGQTFYTKNMRQNCIFTDGNEVPGVLPDRYVSLDKTIIQEESVPDTQKEATRKSVQNACLADRRFILNSTAIMSLLNNPNFKQNITIGKVLKIIHFLMEGKASTPYVAKKFEVSKEFVEIIKSCIQQND